MKPTDFCTPAGHACHQGLLWIQKNRQRTFHSRHLVLACSLALGSAWLHAQTLPAGTATTFTTGGMAFNTSACAGENSRCTFTGSRSVAYGAQGTFTVKTMTGAADCNNSVFGDPLNGTQKACYLQAGTAPPPPTPTPPLISAKIQLPIEVLGEQGTTTAITFKLDKAGDATAATDLYLQTHNVRYADKASVKINNGAWVNLNNSTVKMTGTSAPNRLNKTVAANDAYKGPVTEGYGGIGGAIAVLKMKLPIAANSLKQGDNTITFRFNTSNGVSMGYRVIDINLLDSVGNKILPASAFEESLPASWTAPKPAQADIDAGKNLWMTAQLKTNYLPSSPNIIAKCTDCHTATGRDLKYFGYSNKSIVERSKFHGLSALQGEQIASYIRTLPVKAVGRPWNPPYQPGPGLTSKPNDEWAAGAGINNVLDNDWDTIKAIFPSGVKRDALMIGDTNKFKRFSTHDTPLAFQLPDWNHWLPEVHPYDAFGKTNVDGTDNFKMYKEIRQSLEGKTPAQIKDWFNNSFPRQANAAPKGYFAFTGFGGNHFPGEIAKKGWVGQLNGNMRVNKADTENARKVYSAQLWKMVKHVELHEEFGLTSMGKETNNVAWAGFDSKEALPRMWVGAERVVFDVSPFLSSLEEGITGSASGNNDFNYDYLSNSWYQLQLILNAGQRSGGGHRVVDFGYNYGFLNGMDRLTNYSQAGRNLVWTIKGMDEGDNDHPKGPNQPDGWSMRRADEGYSLGLNNDFVWSKFWLTAPTASAREVLNMVHQVKLEKNASWLPHQFANNPDGTPKNGDEDGATFNRPDHVVNISNPHPRSQADGTYELMAKMAALNSLPAALRNGYATWAQAIWPGPANQRNNWLQFGVGTVGGAPGAPSVTAGTAGAVTVSWATTGAKSVNVKRSDSPNGPFLTIAYFRTGSSYAETAPMAGTGRTYYYHVSTNSDAGESPDSASQSIAR